MHRYGLETEFAKIELLNKSIENSPQGKSLIETKGESTIEAYTGFIDLAGFSDWSLGKSPTEIRNYIVPFLNGAINIVEKFGGITDKTIGDEIMFFIPYVPESELTGQFPIPSRFLERLSDLTHLKSPNATGYRLRAAMSFGKVALTQIGNNPQGYQEWAIFGESIHIAKRLMTAPEAENPDPFVGLYGIKDTIAEKNWVLEPFLASIDSRFTKHTLSFKGVGNIFYGAAAVRNNGGVNL